MIIEYLTTSRRSSDLVKRIILENVLNKHNDMLCFYIIFVLHKGMYYITDEGETLFDINPDMKEPNKEISEILKKYGISFANGEIFIYADKNELYKKEDIFINALTDINNLCIKKFF